MYTVSKDSQEKIDAEISRLHLKYTLETVQELEIIAKEEYGVQDVIESRAVFVPTVIQCEESNLYILYNGLFNQGKRLSLGHEIGHVFMNHFEEHKSIFTEEAEANYFSAKLNKIPTFHYYMLSLFYDVIDVWVESVRHPFIKEREIKKLKERNLYHLLQREEGKNEPKTH